MDGPQSRTAPLHPQPDWVKRRRIDVDEYHRMAEAGILGPRDRVELIEGELIEMPAMAVPHILRVMKLTRLLSAAVGERAILAPQLPARLGRFSEPEPDFALVRPAYLEAATTPPTPSDILLLIEVSDSTLRYDRITKATLYARYGIAEYWIMDVQDNALILHREPGEDGYAITRQAGAAEVLEPLLLPGLRLAVADLLA
jgi:Uma2 family endonuclease